MQRTQCERLGLQLGLQLGRHVNLQCFGVAGRLARNAPSVGAPCRTSRASSCCTTAVARSTCRYTHDGAVTLGYGAHVPGIKHADRVDDRAVAAALGYRDATIFTRAFMRRTGAILNGFRARLTSALQRGCRGWSRVGPEKSSGPAC